MRYAIAIVITLLIGVGAYFWYLQFDAPEQEFVPRPVEEYREITGEPTPQELSLTVAEYEFNPDTMTVPADTLLILSVTNEGDALHNFVIEETNIRSANILPGDLDVVEFYLDPGEYTYYCSIPGHSDQGLTGTLIAE